MRVKKFILRVFSLGVVFSIFNANTLRAEDIPFDIRLQRVYEFFEEKKEKYNSEYKGSLDFLIKNDFTITDECFKKIKKDDGAPLVIDLFEGDNLIIALKKVIEFYSNTDNVKKDNNFIFYTKEFNTINMSDKFNKDLTDKFSNILKALDGKNLDSEKNESDDAYYFRLRDAREPLAEVCDFIKKTPTGVKTYESLVKFIKGVIIIINTLEASVMAEKILEEKRADIEGEMVRTTFTKSVSASVGILATPVIGTKIGLNYEFKKGRGSDSLYQISHKAGLSGGITIGIPSKIVSLSASANVSGDITKAALFFSIEQMLDSGKLRKGDQGIIDESIFYELVNSRDKLQKSEKALLSIFSSDIEGFLRILQIIPLNVYVRWPQITRVEAPMSSLSGTLAAELGLEIDFAVKAGFSVTPHYTNTVFRKSCPFLSLIDENCLPVGNLKIEDIKEIIGEKYNISGKILDQMRKQEQEAYELKASLKTQNELEEKQSKLEEKQNKLIGKLGGIYLDSKSNILKGTHKKNKENTEKKVALDKKLKACKKELRALEKKLRELKNKLKNVGMYSNKEVVYLFSYVLTNICDYLSILKNLAALEAELDNHNNSNHKGLTLDVKMKNPDQDKEIKELETLKHEYEKKLGVKGRLEVFKTYVLTAAIFRSMIKPDNDDKSESQAANKAIFLSKKVFMELENLSSFLEFSKNKKSRSGDFTYSSSHISDIGFSAKFLLNSLKSDDFKIPLNLFKNNSFSFIYDYHNISGSPFSDENGKYMSFSLKLPFNSIKSGINLIKKIIEKVKNKTDNSDDEKDKQVDFNLTEEFLNDASVILGTIVGSISSDIVREIGLPYMPTTDNKDILGNVINGIMPNFLAENGLSISSLSISSLMPSLSLIITNSTIRIDKSDANSPKPVPLPGLGIFKRSESKYMKECTTCSLAYSKPYKFSKYEQTTKVLGTQTLSHIISRFNAWQMGVYKENSISTAWNSLKAKNRNEFMKIINNLGHNYGNGEFDVVSEPKLNVLYELQCIYNDILSNNTLDDNNMLDGINIDQIFENLINKCQDCLACEYEKAALNKPNEAEVEQSKCLNEALKALDKVFMLNYKYNFKRHFDEKLKIKE
jgi:hypothetical protein